MKYIMLELIVNYALIVATLKCTPSSVAFQSTFMTHWSDYPDNKMILLSDVPKGCMRLDRVVFA